MSDPDQELRVEQSLARGVAETPRAVDRAPGDLAERLSRRLRQEVDSADLPLPNGSAVEVVALAEVEQWLLGCAIRLRAGEHL